MAETPSDDLLEEQGILKKIQNDVELAIAQDIEEDRLTQNAPEVEDIL